MNYKKSKREKIHNIVSRLLLIAVSASIVIGILLYNSNVKLANSLSEISESIDGMDEEIASNKNELYSLTDFQDLEGTILDLGLIKELNPNYLDLAEVSQLTYR